MIPPVWSGADALDDAVMTERQRAWDAYIGQPESYPWPNWVIRVRQEGDRYAVQRDAMWQREVHDTERAAAAMLGIGLCLGFVLGLAVVIFR